VTVAVWNSRKDRAERPEPAAAPPGDDARPRPEQLSDYERQHWVERRAQQTARPGPGRRHAESAPPAAGQEPFPPGPPRGAVASFEPVPGGMATREPVSRESGPRESPPREPLPREPVPAPREQVALHRPFWGPMVVDRPTDDFEPKPPLGGACYRPDTEFDGWSTPYATLRLASVRGYKHRYYGKPRQDHAQAAVHEPSGAIVFAVADGVSSARSAELGAVLACEAAIKETIDQLDANRAFDWPRVLQRAADRLTATARRMSEDPDPALAEKLLATTLVVGAAWAAESGLNVSLAQAGDSGAWALDQGRFHSLLTPKTDADAAVVSNAVSPLPRVPNPPVQRELLLPAHAVLLVGTDGFGDPLGDGDGRVGELFARHLVTPPPPRGLAHLLDFSRETFDDDRTLLALWPRAAEHREPR
jgi:hypothetical protein